ncbi:MAG: hypothetical protein K1X79_06095 [Oligoflexia bacterium]|nr:hypothetical protein [Oligoflexia bacterium]
MTSPGQSHELTGALQLAIKEIDRNCSLPCSDQTTSGESRMSRDGSIVTARWDLKEFGIEPPLTEETRQAMLVELVDHGASLRFNPKENPTQLELSVDLATRSIHDLGRATVSLWQLVQTSDAVKKERAGVFADYQEERVPVTNVYLPDLLSTDPDLLVYRAAGRLTAYHYNGEIVVIFDTLLQAGSAEATEVIRILQQARLELTLVSNPSGRTTAQIRSAPSETGSDLNDENVRAQALASALINHRDALKPLASAQLEGGLAQRAAQEMIAPDAEGLREPLGIILARFPQLHRLWHFNEQPTTYDIGNGAGLLLLLPETDRPNNELVSLVLQRAQSFGIEATPVAAEGSPIIRALDCKVFWAQASLQVGVTRQLLNFLLQVEKLIPSA